MQEFWLGNPTFERWIYSRTVVVGPLCADALAQSLAVLRRATSPWRDTNPHPPKAETGRRSVFNPCMKEKQKKKTDEEYI